MKLFTLAEIATRIAEVTGRNAVEVHTRLRNPAMARHLSPSNPNRGRTAAALYSGDNIIRALTLLTVQEIGLDSTLGDAINSALAAATQEPMQIDPLGVYEAGHPLSAKIEGGYYYYPNALESAKRGVAKGEDWELRLTFRSSQTGKPNVSAKIAPSKWPGYRYDELIELSGIAGGRILGELVIPLSPIIGPLIGADAD